MAEIEGRPTLDDFFEFIGSSNTKKEVPNTQKPTIGARLRAAGETILMNKSTRSISLKATVGSIFGSGIGYALSRVQHTDGSSSRLAIEIVGGLIPPVFAVFTEGISSRAQKFERALRRAQPGEIISFEIQGSVEEAWRSGVPHEPQTIVYLQPKDEPVFMERERGTMLDEEDRSILYDKYQRDFIRGRGERIAA